jgi:hypothetical protein
VTLGGRGNTSFDKGVDLFIQSFAHEASALDVFTRWISDLGDQRKIDMNNEELTTLVQSMLHLISREFFTSRKYWAYILTNRCRMKKAYTTAVASDDNLLKAMWIDPFKWMSFKQHSLIHHLRNLGIYIPPSGKDKELPIELQRLTARIYEREFNQTEPRGSWDFMGPGYAYLFSTQTVDVTLRQCAPLDMRVLATHNVPIAARNAVQLHRQLSRNALPQNLTVGNVQLPPAPRGVQARQDSQRQPIDGHNQVVQNPAPHVPPVAQRESRPQLHQDPAIYDGILRFDPQPQVPQPRAALRVPTHAEVQAGINQRLQQPLIRPGLIPDWVANTPPPSGHIPVQAGVRQQHWPQPVPQAAANAYYAQQIGRASCRERV